MIFLRERERLCPFSQPHMTTGRVKVLYNRILTNLHTIQLFIRENMNQGHVKNLVKKNSKPFKSSWQ